MVKDWVSEAAQYVLFDGAEAVMEQRPTPLMLPLVVQGPEAVKLTASPDEAVALNEKELPYCTLGNVAKLIVCDFVPEPCGRTMNVPDTVFAALKAVVPGCDAVTVQLPVLLRMTVAEETLFAID